LLTGPAQGPKGTAYLAAANIRPYIIAIESARL
jgi:hypothetical protein